MRHLFLVWPTTEKRKKKGKGKKELTFPFDSLDSEKGKGSKTSMLLGNRGKREKRRSCF